MKSKILTVRETQITLSSLFFFCAGMGIVYALIIHNPQYNAGIFSKENLVALQQVLESEYVKVFLYVLSQRWLVIPVLFFMGTTYYAKVSGYIFAGWYGISVGVVIGIALLEYGVVGILLILAAAFPHYLLYVPIFLIAYKWNSKLREIGRRFWVEFFSLEGLVFLGCYAECFINPKLLNKICDIFL